MASSLFTCGRQSCRARLFTTSAIVRKSTRLPSFAEIRAIKLKQYAEEIGTHTPIPFQKPMILTKQ